METINLLLNKRSKTTNVSCLDVEGRNVTDNSEIAHSMNDFFCSIGRKLSDDIPQQPNPLLSNEYNINEEGTSFQFKTVYSVSVEKALKKVKTSFGFGSDGIASHFIKIAFPVISHSLCRIYNMSIESGIFPNSWKIARVAPIFKSGSTEGRSNYRPISVLPVVSRLFEKLIYDQLYEYLDSNKHLFIDQYGFRNLHSVVSCLLNCTNDWYVNIDRGKFTAMIFIDLKKAFDTVDHQILLNKMRNYGINGLEHQWFSSYLDNRRQFCKVNGVCSDLAEINIGVPQGSCLGPLLFLIYINDLPFALKRAKATMYADDTAISFSSDNIEEIDAVVNAELACLEKWLQGNKLSLNVVKTQAMIIGSSQKLRKIDTPMVPIPHFQVNGKDIDLVKETKYLGLMIDDNLKWESNVVCTQKKISRAIGRLKYAKHYVQEDTLRNMYLSIVQPHFSHCCSVWGCCGATKLKTLQKLQNRAARIVTGSPFDTPAAPLLQRLGWPSIDKLINRETCTMVFKSLNDLAPENLGNIFSKLSDVHARVLRNTKCNLALPKMRTAYGQKSFAFRGANAWNKLDSEMKLAPSIQSFKSKLKASN